MAMLLEIGCYVLGSLLLVIGLVVFVGGARDYSKIFGDVPNERPLVDNAQIVTATHQGVAVGLLCAILGVLLLILGRLLEG